MQKQSIMKTKIIKTELEYNEACTRIYTLMHSSEKPIEPNSSEGEELELLSMLVEKYEREFYPIEAPSPVEAIRFRMEQMNLKQGDIAPLFGGKTRVSEVMNGKRPLSLKMISLLHEYLGIPLELLLTSDKEIKLEPAIRQKLLTVPSIGKFMSLNGKAV
jgi:HTH-type transcriptional regulator / antitoxin HigA